MTGRRRDIDDMDDTLFDREEADRRRLERADAIERGTAAAAMLTKADNAARARVREEILKANDEFILREYQHAGVEPLETNAAGIPLVSLALLLRVGWRIEDLGLGVRKLVAPPPEPKYEAKGECS